VAKILYVAAILDQASSDLLLQNFPPINSVVLGKHMTIAFEPHWFPICEKLGQYVVLRVLGEVRDDHGQAALVAGYESNNYFPHITISHGPEVEASYSNELLRTCKILRVGKHPLFLNARVGAIVEGFGPLNPFYSAAGLGPVFSFPERSPR